jgi:hypothetical protein
MSAQAIYGDLIATLDNGAVSYSRVTKCLRTAQFDSTKIPSNRDPSSHHLTSTTPAGVSWQPLRKGRSSVREFSRATHLPPTTVYRRLINSLGSEFGRAHLRCDRMFCPMLRNCNALNNHRLYCGCSRSRNREPGLIL